MGRQQYYDGIATSVKNTKPPHRAVSLGSGTEPERLVEAALRSGPIRTTVARVADRSHGMTAVDPAVRFNDRVWGT